MRDLPFIHTFISDAIFSDLPSEPEERVPRVLICQEQWKSVRRHILNIQSRIFCNIFISSLLDSFMSSKITNTQKRRLYLCICLFVCLFVLLFTVCPTPSLLPFKTSDTLWNSALCSGVTGFGSSSQFPQSCCSHLLPAQLFVLLMFYFLFFGVFILGLFIWCIYSWFVPHWFLIQTETLSRHTENT